MRNFTTQGIVIHRRTRFEKDYGVTLFTPLYGKINTYAKGARNIKSKFTGHLDLLNVCNFQLYDGPNNTLITECQLTKSYTKLRENLEKFYIGENIAKMILTFSTENESNEDIYTLLTDTLETLEDSKKETLIYEAFKIKLFSLVGSLPDMYSLNDTEFIDIDFKLKKLMNFLHTKPYSEISRVYLNPTETNLLQKMTTNLLEYAM